MFDIGWSELLLIAVIVLFAFGPEDIPKIMYNLGRFMRRFRYMRFALSSQFEDFMEKAEAQGRRQHEAQKQAADPQHEARRQASISAESDADEMLLDMMPPPAQMPETQTQPLPPIDHDRPDTTPAPAREPVRRD